MKKNSTSIALFDAVDIAVAEAHRLKTSATAWAKAGTALLRTGHVDDAAECIRKGLEADRQSPDALIAMGQLHIERFNEDAAIAVFLEAKAMRPNDTVIDGYLRLLSSVMQ